MNFYSLYILTLLDRKNWASLFFVIVQLMITKKKTMKSSIKTTWLMQATCDFSFKIDPFYINLSFSHKSSYRCVKDPTKPSSYTEQGDLYTMEDLQENELPKRLVYEVSI